MSTDYSEEVEKESVKWMLETSRFEKLDHIMETASIEFKDTFLNEIVRWMGEDEFDEFFKHLQSNWGIMTP
jgi:hypothetical protein